MAVDLAATVVEEGVGASIGVGVGAVVAGPLGAVGGAVAGGVIGKALKGAVDDFLGRLLSDREQKRVETVADLAQARIEKNLNEGQQPRSDGFFDDGVANRSDAAELFEGTLIAAQKEYEEKKLPLIANLNANIAFDATVSPAEANRLLKIAGELTYRQLLILKVTLELQVFDEQGLSPAGLSVRKGEAYGELTGIESITMASDLYDLCRRCLVFSKEAVLGPAGINPSKLYVAGYGARLYILMDLRSVERDADTSAIYSFMVGGNESSVAK